VHKEENSQPPRGRYLPLFARSNSGIDYYVFYIEIIDPNATLNNAPAADAGPHARPEAPFAMFVQLSRTNIPDEMHEAHTRQRAWRMTGAVPHDEAGRFLADHGGGRRRSVIAAGRARAQAAARAAARLLCR
jgi:hypothetical protein